MAVSVPKCHFRHSVHILGYNHPMFGLYCPITSTSRSIDFNSRTLFYFVIEGYTRLKLNVAIDTDLFYVLTKFTWRLFVRERIFTLCFLVFLCTICCQTTVKRLLLLQQGNGSLLQHELGLLGGKVNAI